MKRDLKQDLINWKEQDEHLPLLLRGARQVGKSYLVEEFGREQFENLAVVDFEQRPESRKVFTEKDPRRIIEQLELILKTQIVPQKTLLFLDEIQLCPEALMSLRYFKEQLPELHVIGAGSLLEFLLNERSFSFPVGRIEFLYLRPFSFCEYLEACWPLVFERLQKFSLNSPPTEVEHNELTRLFRRYLFVGGMPDAVKVDMQGKSLAQIQRVHHRILQSYESDFGKYENLTKTRYLQTVFNKAPSVVGQILKYNRIDQEVRSRDLKPAIDTLCHAGLLQRVFATTAAGNPIHSHLRLDRYKLFFLDAGLLQTATQVDAQQFFENDILQINAGMLAEQSVAQELLAYSPTYQNRPMLFWENTSKGASAEVDFVISHRENIIPIEVKAGETGLLRSLASFLELKNSPLGIRISQRPLALKNRILSVPLYLIHSLDDLISEAL